MLALIVNILFWKPTFGFGRKPANTRAPHEPVSAPAGLISEFRTKFPDLDQTRLENLAAVKAIDNQMAKILEVAEKLDRETIVIFQSDNGGTSSYLDDGKRSARGCNFPYKGFKSTLFEGGTLSPSFIYSTKQRFPNREVSSMLHITDWFPTILWFARINLPDNLDGVNQQIHIRTVLHIGYSASPRFLRFQNVENRAKEYS